MNRRTFVKNAGYIGLAAGLPTAGSAAVSNGQDKKGNMLLQKKIPVDGQWDVIVAGGGSGFRSNFRINFIHLRHG
ncbi:MAG: hypothetical protein LBC19_04595 [Tannerella sp.]|jgi:hypothetical protein|nr:hypothetical protein [Tannerella sp.]